MINLKYTIFILITALLLSNCVSDKEKNEAVAKVNGAYLYKADLTGLISIGTSPKDSISIVKNFINNWIKQKLVIQNAQNNLSSSQQNFDKQIEDYRNSLIVYAYEKELIRQKLDTSVSETTIKAYYDKNQNEFLLKDNIVKVCYVKLPINSSVKANVASLYKSDVLSAKQSLEDYAKKYAVNYFFDDSTWLYFKDLLKEIPIKTYNQEDYLKFHRFIEMEDSLFSYFVNIKGFQIKESVSPLSFERDNVKKIILNKRKLKLIEDMQNEIFQDALKKNDFVIY